MLLKYTYFWQNTHMRTHTHKHEIHVHAHTQAHRAVIDTLKSTKHQHIRTSKTKHRHTHAHTARNKHTKTRTNTSTDITMCVQVKRVQVCPHALEGYIWVLGNGGKRKVGEAGYGRAQARHCLTCMVTGGHKEKKATPTTGPKRQQTQHSQCSKNRQCQSNVFLS